jgi:thioredoxin
MEILTKETFKQKVFDFEKSDKGWAFAGQRPAIVDFYADWCGPCKAVAPVLDQISKEYDGRVDVYKVNTDMEPDIANAFGVSSIPTILFIPTEGQPQVSRGAMPKNSFVQAINDIFKIR